jgi:hypothetical protein
MSYLNYLSPGAPERKTLDKVRAAIDQIDGRVAALRDAPLTADEVRAQFAASIAALRESDDIDRAVRCAVFKNSDFYDLVKAPLTLASLADLIGEKTVLDALTARAKPHCADGVSEKERIARLQDQGFALDRPYALQDVGAMLAVWDEVGA